ncbi:MAG: DUF294 nucleotidyltransferase-like domain-containing protein, partial [Acidimicrobiia bacterium]|nr:DUF294 nucleotidyltransferase-like domain-containing protein [Acidimicrobiia bacterium]
MSGNRSPSRFGIWPELVPRFTQAGWLADGEIDEAAVPLLRAVRAGPDPEGALERLASIFDRHPQLATRTLADFQLGLALVAVVGASRAFSQAVMATPDMLLGPEQPPPPAPDLGETHAQALHAIRRFVGRSMLHIAVRDLMGYDGLAVVGRALADLADRAATIALESAHREVRRTSRFAHLPEIPIAVIAMGKWGGRELNYSSDIDVLFVFGNPGAADPSVAAEYARRVCATFMSSLSQVTVDGSAYRVDADLRPEGKNGPLVRTVDSYKAYYERWASTWEFQALIKSRPAAGD